MSNKFWFVALHEYRKHVFQKRFLLAILSVPALLVASFAAGFLAEFLSRNSDPVGYVDQAGVLADPIALPVESEILPPVEIVAYPDEAAAEAALASGEIQAYYLLPAEYESNREVVLVFIDEPGDNAEGDFYDFMQLNASDEISESVRIRLLEGFTTVARSVDGSREFSERKVLNLLLPILFGFIFTFVLTSGSGYLANAVTEEKENRTIEVLSTSMSANQFIIGKVLGIVLVIFTQVVSWLGFFVIAFFSARAVFDEPWIAEAELDPNIFAALLLVFIPAFFFFAGIALTISSTVTESSEGQQAIGIISMPVGFSYWLVYPIMSNPGSPFSVGLSLFPLTAPTLMPMRLAFGVVPWQQLAICVGILSLGSMFTIWLAARAYEMGMMQYGKRIRIQELLRPARKGGRK